MISQAFPLEYEVLIPTALACYAFNRITHLLSSNYSSTYQKLNECQKAEWCMRAVALVNAVVTTYFGFLVATNEVVQRDLLFGRDERMQTLCSFAIGYWTYDFLMNVYYYRLFEGSKLDVLFHHICCGYMAYIVCTYSLFVCYAAAELIFAVTDVTNHIGYFTRLITAPSHAPADDVTNPKIVNGQRREGSRAYKAVFFVHLIMFIAVRVLLGWYLLAHSLTSGFWTAVFDSGSTLVHVLAATWLLFTALNVVWLKQVFAHAKKLYFPSGSAIATPTTSPRNRKPKLY